MNIRKIICAVLLVFAVFGSLVSCQGENPVGENPKTKARSFYDFFDTVSAIMSYKGDSEAEFSANADAVGALLGEYHKLFDIYHEYSGINNIRTVNKNAGIAPVEVDPRLIDFLVYAKDVYTLTEGKTNIAMGSVLRLWHDAREYGMENPDKATLPDSAALSEAKLHTDIDDIIIDRENSTVYLADGKMSLDVGAIGKGYAVERAAELLISRGVSSYVLNVGGNIRAIGEKPGGEGWLTGITNPDKASGESFACKVRIKNTSLVTSGDYERYYTVDGVKYHHIIDPVSNMPAAYFSSVSVFTLDSGLADALSTALFCMSYEDGARIVSAIDGVEVIWITRSGEIKKTDGIALE